MENLNNCPICGNQKFDKFISVKDYFLSGEMFEIVKCAQCGFKFTNPRPFVHDLSKYYQSKEYISHSNQKKGLFNSLYQKVRNYTLRKKYKLIEKYAQKGRLLDIGCATGHFLNEVKKHGWQVTGIEPDENSRSIAIKDFGLEVFSEAQLNIFPNASFDVITLWHVLEHVPNVNERVGQLKRLLKPNGTLVVAVPNAEAFDAEIYGNFWAAYDVPRHLYHFSKNDIQNLFEKFGFMVTEILPMKFDAFYVSLLSEKYKYGKMRWINGFWSGLRSNLKKSQKMNHSSLIFVLKIK